MGTLTQLVYASRASAAVSLQELKAINLAAVRSNTANGLTGMLLYGGSHFLQVLEGDRAAVSHTYQRIGRDKRHVSPTLLSVTEITERQFSKWAMRFAMLDSSCGAPTRALLEQLGVTAFEPLSLASVTAVRLLLEVTAANVNCQKEPEVSMRRQ